nr:hypothetical protein [Escherichia coli]
MLRIEPVPSRPRLRGQRPANASGLRPPRFRLASGFALRAGAWRLASAASQVRRYLSCPVIKPFRWRGSFRL